MSYRDTRLVRLPADEVVTNIGHRRPSVANRRLPHGLRSRLRSMPVTVDGPGRRADQHERDNTRNVKKIAFVSGRPELRSSLIDTQQLDGTEAIWQMDRENRHQKQNQGRNAHKRNKGSSEEGDAGDKLSGDCYPGNDVRHGNARGLKNASERFWSSRPFRQTMCQKPITDNQSKRDPSVRHEFLPSLLQNQCRPCQNCHGSLSASATRISFLNMASRHRANASTP